MRRFLLTLTAISFAGWTQPAKQPPQASLKAKRPTVACSDKATEKACTSFKQLIEAHDKDILDTISSGTSYVCFRPTDDVFSILHLEKPTQDSWKKDDSVGQTQVGTSGVTLTQYRDGVFYTVQHGRSTWYRYDPNEEPLFSYQSKDGGVAKNLLISIDGSEANIGYSFDNQDKGMTHYWLTIRLSTGRFSERFSIDDQPTITHSGACLIYR